MVITRATVLGVSCRTGSLLQGGCGIMVTRATRSTRPLAMRLLLLVLLVGACAAPPPSPGTQAAPAGIDRRADTAARAGTIVAMRPLGGVDSAAAEVIVRRDDGEITAVILRHAGGFRVGDRVLLGGAPGQPLRPAR